MRIFCSRSRPAKKITAGIWLIFRGLFFEQNAEIGQKGHLWTDTNELFTGKVFLQPLLPESKDYKVSVVHFEKGVRNKLHIHDSDQILIVTGGKGFVANEYEKQEVGVGDIILFPAGEKHWHGATEDSDFSHHYCPVDMADRVNREKRILSQLLWVYVLVAIIKKRLGIDQSLYTILQILSLTLFEKIMLFQLLDVSNHNRSEADAHIQLKLFTS